MMKILQVQDFRFYIQNLLYVVEMRERLLYNKQS